jgi:excisionase family DNA binding protein
MQAYASAERIPYDHLRFLESQATGAGVLTAAVVPGTSVLDELLGELAELVAERVLARLSTPQDSQADEWLDTRRAAEYLGIHRDRLRRLAAEGTIPAEQEGAGCKLYFRRSALAAWRSGGAGSVVRLHGEHHA